MKTEVPKEEPKPEPAKDVGEIGKAFGLLFFQIRYLVAVADLTEADVSKFMEYLSTQEAVGPLFNPNAFAPIAGGMKGTGVSAFKAIEVCREQASLLWKLIQHFKNHSELLEKMHEGKSRIKALGDLDTLRESGIFG